MRTTVATILLAAAIGTVGRAQDRELTAVFDRFDRNDDGAVVRAEFPGSDEQFATADASKDGKLSLAEFAASPFGRRLRSARERNKLPPRPREDAGVLVWRRLEAIGRHDKNRDGRVTKSEWAGAPPAFYALDLDRSGVLDKKDKALAKKRVPVEEVSDPYAEFRSYLPDPARLIKRLDRNKDMELSEREVVGQKFAHLFGAFDRDRSKTLSADELTRLVGAVRARVALRNRGNVRPRAYEVPFSTWDKDKDGRLESGEWQQRSYLFQRIDINRDGAVTREEVARYKKAFEGKTFVDRFDLDEDGRVTRNEFGGAREVFERADRNGDGVVTSADR